MARMLGSAHRYACDCEGSSPGGTSRKYKKICMKSAKAKDKRSWKNKWATE